jgi:hypothetical protein
MKRMDVVKKGGAWKAESGGGRFPARSKEKGLDHEADDHDAGLS